MRDEQSYRDGYVCGFRSGFIAGVESGYAKGIDDATRVMIKEGGF